MAPSRDSHKVKLGLLGSGVVGEAIQEFIFNGYLPGKLAVDLEIVKIYTPHPAQKSRYSTHRALFTTDPEEVTDHPEIDIVVEVLGSQDESHLALFRDYIIRALQKGKAVVTSDKAVLARFGREIREAARKYHQELRFEACVGGGIPIIRALTEGFAAEEPEAIYGIVNGTCNYILSEMEKGGSSYEQALKEAQDRGYAETNPKADTSGMDAEAKLILLAAVTFGLHVKPGVIWRKGIEEISPIDFLYAGRKGACTIKQLAIARKADDAIEALVAPVLVPRDHFLATINGPTNAIFFKGRRSQETFVSLSRTRPLKGKVGNQGSLPEGRDWNYVFVGPGAGGGPTAVAILGDVCELAQGRGRRLPGPPSLVAPGGLAVQSQDKICSRFYLRFIVEDQPGIVGDICQILGGRGINVSEIWQLHHSQDELKGLAQRYRLTEKAGQILPFAITLEKSSVGQVQEALATIHQRDFVVAHPIWLPIWGLE